MADDQLLARYRVAAGTRFRFRDLDPGDDCGFDKAATKTGAAAHTEKLALWQNRLFGEAKQALLLVLQGMDAAGKDGVIRRVFTGVNPQGCRVTSFKAPTEHELAQDYLWRIHANLPRRGEIGIFNRSHYEDIVTVEVLGLIGRQQRERRIDHVRRFEQMLSDEGTRLVKVFLHVSPEEQQARLQARIDDPEKHWKFNPADIETRARWVEYHDRYEHVIGATSTDAAPWYVIPADRKWVRDELVARLIVSVLADMAPQLPATDGIDGTVVPDVPARAE